MYRRRTIILTALYSLASVVLFASPVLAFDEQFYDTNDITFYDPRSGACEPGAGGIAIGGGLPSDTVSYLEGQDIKGLAEKNKERYERAQSETGVPWQAMAAIHYREARMDSQKSISNGAPLGSGTNVDGVEVVADANQDAVNMAKLFKELAAGVYGIDLSSSSSVTTEGWGQAFLAYNRGYLYKEAGTPYTSSPYVMNGFDETHMNMSWPGPPADPAVSGADGNKAGALAVFLYLGGSAGGSVSCSNASNGIVAGSVVKTALGLAQPHEIKNGTTNPSAATPQYREAIVTHNKSVAKDPEITDCGRFVSTVLRASGVDPEFPDVYVPTQIDYMNQSEKYTSLGTIEMGAMRPGDIIATPGHIMIYTGANGSYVAVDASYTERVPGVRPATSVQWMIDEKAGVWRVK